LLPAAGPSSDPPAFDSAQGTVISRMAECVDASERARCALTVLLEHGCAAEGHLFGWIDGRLTHLSSITATPRSQAFLSRLEAFLESELEAIETTAPGGSPHSTLPPGGDALDAELARFRVVPLYGQRDGEPVVAAVGALYSGQRPPPLPSSTLLAALADSLLEHDDVDAVTRLL